MLTNCVRHAETAADAPLRLIASLHTRMLRIEISDTGIDGAVARRPPRFGDGDGDGAGGFGLDLVADLSSAWGVERGPQGTTVWLELPVAAEADG